jgi:fumarylpyruvate hydrolase
MNFAFPAPAHPAIPIEGSSLLFPVRRIWCVGRNYAEHAREMGGDASREPPFFFAKPADAVVVGGGELPYPAVTTDLHHEVELAVAISGGGSDIAVKDAERHVFGYALALDMTRRDLQAEAKRMARPWDMAKGFDQSCPISAIRPANPGGGKNAGPIWLTINGDERQRGDISDMIWTVAECIATLSSLVRLAPGDLLLTGTPAGVGPVAVGDLVEAHCALTPSLTVTYLQRPAAVIGDAGRNSSASDALASPAPQSHSPVERRPATIG